jgi:hypothetical protein
VGVGGALDEDRAGADPELDLVREAGLLDDGFGQADTARVPDADEPGLRVASVATV